MPKLIDYPRTSYTGAWELAEVTDDTGGKCAIETAARKMDRKVSGSFKAIIGSAVKFGLLTSKRDLLTTTTLFKRIKHAYDKQEEIVFHREAFLTPPLFTQICRKFRSRELPIQMLDVMLIREFGVEEINSQGVAKAFVDGARMVGLLDEHNIIADIDTLSAKQGPRREVASPLPNANTFRQETEQQIPLPTVTSNILNHPVEGSSLEIEPKAPQIYTTRPAATKPLVAEKIDAIASLFGFTNSTNSAEPTHQPTVSVETQPEAIQIPNTPIVEAQNTLLQNVLSNTPALYQIQVTGPGINTALSITEEEDIALAISLLEKIRRQLRA